jgi:hypothetical protein
MKKLSHNRRLIRALAMLKEETLEYVFSVLVSSSQEKEILPPAWSLYCNVSISDEETVRGSMEVEAGSSPAPAQERPRFKRNRRRAKARNVSNATEQVEQMPEELHVEEPTATPGFAMSGESPTGGMREDGGAGSQRASVLKEAPWRPAYCRNCISSAMRGYRGETYFVSFPSVDAVLVDGVRSMWCDVCGAFFPFEEVKSVRIGKRPETTKKKDVSWKAWVLRRRWGEACRIYGINSVGSYQVWSSVDQNRAGWSEWAKWNGYSASDMTTRKGEVDRSQDKTGASKPPETQPRELHPDAVLFLENWKAASVNQKEGESIPDFIRRTRQRLREGGLSDLSLEKAVQAAVKSGMRQGMTRRRED